MDKNRIRFVEPGSLAQEIGVEAGDYLTAINGTPVLDILDYRYKTSENRFLMSFVSPLGEELEAEIEKEDWEDIGLTFENELMSAKRACANNCVFCFIDQLPGGTRSTLHFKDDDWRLSFLSGNYVTLTNVGFKELERIIEQRISPLFISVHATNAQVRKQMMRNERAGDILEKLRVLSDGGIDFYAQIVLCPGYNDGAVLSKTLEELSSFRPNLLGIAVVPVGLSQYREGLTQLRRVEKADAFDIIRRIEASPVSEIAFPADEIYLLADAAFPPAEKYGDFEMFEDGIGMIRRFEQEFFEAIDEQDTVDENAVIVTGESAYPFMAALAGKLKEVFGTTVDVFKIKNTFFGGNVSVVGLLTGSCLIKALADKVQGRKLLIPQSMMRQDADVFLDDQTPEIVEQALGAQIEIVANDGFALYNALIQEREMNG